jgi:hypothetical protein
VKVDRIAFLGLVTAVAAAACVVTSTETDGEGGSAGSGNANQGGSGNTSQGGSDVGGADVGGADVGGADVGGGNVGGSEPCDDNVGSPADCANVPLECDPYCQAAHNNLKPLLGEIAVQCLTNDTSDYCDTGYTCVADALAEACPDATADADCAAAVTACGDVTADECHAMIDGLTEAARAEVMTCVTDGCEFGLYSCVEGVSFWMEV